MLNPKLVTNFLDKFSIVTYDSIVKVSRELANKQSALDVIPCKIFKQIIPELMPALYAIINNSLSTGQFPSILKISSVTPAIKSTKLDADIYNNYRPISNLTILSKLLEKCVLEQLNKHLYTNNLYPIYQSAYRLNYSCETTVIKIFDDIIANLNKNSYIVMAFLDFSAAFDTVDHQLLINKLEKNFGITGTALNWFRSYLDNRKFQVKINNTFSDLHNLKYGVPQGSILGPILYSLYVAEIEEIASSYNINVHVYADDVILYASSDCISEFKECIDKINQWTSANYLKLNNKKTQLMCLSPKRSTINKPLYINLLGENISVQSSAKYLGVWLDENLTMTKQVNNVCKQGYLMLRNLWRISSKVSDISIRTQLINTCILSKLNFCNAIYHSLPQKEIYKLDKLLKAGARYIFKIYGTERRQPMTPYLQQLHFLPMKYRLDFKINMLVYKCFENQAPDYLISLLLPRNLDSKISTRKDSDSTWLNQYPIEKLNYKCRNFRHIAPKTWNKLNIMIRESPSLDAFQTRLKMFYFQQWLNQI